MSLLVSGGVSGAAGGSAGAPPPPPQHKPPIPPPAGSAAPVAATQSEMSAFKAVGSQLAVTAGKSSREMRGKLLSDCCCVVCRRDQASQLPTDQVPSDREETGEGEGERQRGGHGVSRSQQ